MNDTRIRILLVTSLAAAVAAGCTSAPSSPPMSFFVTSVGSGKGADLGGLAGADRHCQALASAAGAGSRRWAAYLSTHAASGGSTVHARDRIGTGPWRNAKGEVIAASLDELHGNNKLTKQTALTEKGQVVNGRGDNPNQHDVLTGSMPDGRASEFTCNNWTSSTTGAAIVGHSDRTGLDESAPARSWNSSHQTRGGCSQDALRGTGGAGLYYCFAAN